MSSLLLGVVSAVLASNTPAALDNVLTQTTGMNVAAAAESKDPADVELKKLMERDDALHEEIDRMIRDNQEFGAKGGGLPREELLRRVREKQEPMRKAYEEFLARHPKHVDAHVAFSSFLSDLGDEEGEVKHLEIARELDPKDPAVWNNLANHYGHDGPTKKAFEYYEKAIELGPNESVYYQNYAATVYLFRKDAREYFNINEQQVFDKSLALYSNALRLDPTNFPLATDLAQSYYAIRPLRTNDALVAWTNALKIAHDDIEREGVYLHFARVKLAAGRFDEVRQHLKTVTNAMYGDLKNRLERNLALRENEAKGTNQVTPVSESTTNAPKSDKAESP